MWRLHKNTIEWIWKIPIFQEVKSEEACRIVDTFNDEAQ